jgi:plastocyanin
MRKGVLLFVPVILVATACSGDNKSSTAAAGGAKVNDHGTKSVTSGGSLTVEADDFYFNPTFIKGPAGAKVKLDLKNEGKATHTFTIDGGVDQEVAAGGNAHIEVTLPASGSLTFYCRFHRSGGMQGALVTG